MRQASWSDLPGARRALPRRAVAARAEDRRGGAARLARDRASDPRPARRDGAEPLRWSVTTSSTSPIRRPLEAARHPRFDARVFAAGERARLGGRERGAQRAPLGALGREGGGLQGGAPAGSRAAPFLARAFVVDGGLRAPRRALRSACACCAAPTRVHAHRDRPPSARCAARPRASRRLPARSVLRRRRARARPRRRRRAARRRRGGASRSSRDGRVPRAAPARQRRARSRSRSRTTAASSPSPCALAERGDSR